MAGKEDFWEEEIDVQMWGYADMQMGEEVHLNGVFEKEQQLDNLSKCLETLSSEQKTVVELFYLQHKCYKDIETMTGLEWNKVRSHIQNGRRNLKICMEQQAFSMEAPIVKLK